VAPGIAEPRLFFAREEGVLLSPQDQRRHVDLTELVHVIPIDRKHRPFHVVAPDVGRKLEALGDHRRKEFFRDQMVVVLSWNSLTNSEERELPARTSCRKPEIISFAGVCAAIKARRLTRWG
jgi:hypothetical protein